jgi:predicted Rossmann fold nucleotide-binding protein DprA/Smf involved in DNA uptake
VAVTKANRVPIAGGRLTLVSPFHPDARWSAGNAMGRNRYIYALSQWTLVVSSATEGGTWSGARESLAKGWGQLVVRDATGTPEGNAKLIALGGLPLVAEAALQAPSLGDLLRSLRPPGSTRGDGAPDLFSNAEEEAPEAETMRVAEADVAADGDVTAQAQEVPAGEHTGDLFEVVWPHLAPSFADERTDKQLAEVAEALGVQVGQMKAWTKRAVQEGYLERKTRPVRYALPG